MSLSHCSVPVVGDGVDDGDGVGFVCFVGVSLDRGSKEYPALLYQPCPVRSRSCDTFNSGLQLRLVIFSLYLSPRRR